MYKGLALLCSYHLVIEAPLDRSWQGHRSAIPSRGLWQPFLLSASRGVSTVPASVGVCPACTRRAGRWRLLIDDSAGRGEEESCAIGGRMVSKGGGIRLIRYLFVVFLPGLPQQGLVPEMDFRKAEAAVIRTGQASLSCQADRRQIPGKMGVRPLQWPSFRCPAFHLNPCPAGSPPCTSSPSWASPAKTAPAPASPAPSRNRRNLRRRGHRVPAQHHAVPRLPGLRRLPHP